MEMEGPDRPEAALPRHGRPGGRWRRPGPTVWAGGILIIVGLYFLLRHFQLLPDLDWEVVWPVILILLGAYFVVRRLR